MTVEKIMTSVLKVMQSRNSVKLDKSFAIEVINVSRLMGAGKTVRRITNISVDRLRKKSILTVPKTEDSQLCCAKAIVYA